MKKQKLPIEMKKVIFRDVKESWMPLLDIPELDDCLAALPENITPPAENIFEFAKYCELSEVRVVILGQDPYPKAGDAHGLAFSCMTNVPASLRNIYKCLLQHKLISSIPSSGDLTYWTQQGVVLLNTALTTITGKDSAHISIWSEYTSKLIEALSEQKTIIKYKGKNAALRPAFMLWGKHAQSKKKFINSHCKVLEYAHPSPLAQHSAPFVECTHFIDINAYFKEVGVPIIDWNVAPLTLENTLGFSDGTIVAFTDGSCYPNNSSPEAKAGFAVCFAYGPFLDTVIYGSIANRPHHATSQRAEGQAIYEVMKYAVKNSTWNHLIIITDSDFWINMFNNYMPAWDSSGLDFNSKKNGDMTRPMYDLYKTIFVDKNVEFRHIKSHNKDGWAKKKEYSYEKFCYDNNDYVDKLANYARLKLAVGDTVISKAAYSDK